MISAIVAATIRLIAGVYLQPKLPPSETGRIYFANHSSHLDFVVIWAVLPPELRKRARPVAAADYWGKGPLRRLLATRLFHAVLIARTEVKKENNPLSQMTEVLKRGSDLILFPEGTRSPDGVLKPFKNGLYHLARSFPGVELMPVGLENLNRILPKGEFLPVPVMGSIQFGAPVPPPADNETRAGFLERCHKAVETLLNPASK